MSFTTSYTVCSGEAPQASPPQMSTFQYLLPQQTVFQQDCFPRNDEVSQVQDCTGDYRSLDSILFINDVSPEAASTSPPATSTPASPFFCDIWQMVASEYPQQTMVPFSLLQVMRPPQYLDVSSREIATLARLKYLRQSMGDQLRDMESLFHHHSASIEMERVKMLSQDITPHYRSWLNSLFDQKRHQAMDRIDQSLQLLESKVKSEKKEQELDRGLRRLPVLTRQAIQVMENWYDSHREHPYPSSSVVEALTVSGRITTEQVRKWFANKRLRNCNTRSLTEIARRKHQARFSMKATHLKCSLQYGDL